MSWFHRQASLLAVVVFISFLVTSCSSSKVDECNKLLQIANKNTSAPATDNTNPKPLAPEQILQQADLADQKAKEMEALEVKDAKLKELKSRFVTLLKDESKALRDAGNAAAEAAKKTDTSSINASLKASDLYLKATDVYNQQISLVGDMTTYCTK